MTVAELIEELKQYPETAQVTIEDGSTSSDGIIELKYEYGEVILVLK